MCFVCVFRMCVLYMCFVGAFCICVLCLCILNVYFVYVCFGCVCVCVSVCVLCPCVCLCVCFASVCFGCVCVYMCVCKWLTGTSTSSIKIYCAMLRYLKTHTTMLTVDSFQLVFRWKFKKINYFIFFRVHLNPGNRMHHPAGHRKVGRSRSHMPTSSDWAIPSPPTLAEHQVPIL